MTLQTLLTCQLLPQSLWQHASGKVSLPSDALAAVIVMDNRRAAEIAASL